MRIALSTPFPPRAHAPRRRVAVAAAPLLATLALAACGRTAPVTATPAPPAPAQARVPRPAVPAVIPAPASMRLSADGGFTVDSGTVIVLDAGAASAVDSVGRDLARILATATGPVVRRLAAGEAPPANSIYLAITPDNSALGAEGYELTIARDRVTLEATQPQGLFYGTQTIRQLLPHAVEHPAALARGLILPEGRVVDAPRFAWRGAMLDVSRHFQPAEFVKRYIDLMALYKLNRLHLHLADDQGWRIEIKSWPNLARHGGSSQVGGGAGGYYTQAEFADIVAHAGRRFVTIVPEIDMPGHTNAALASYPALNCNDTAPPLYTGIRVGFSALCVDRDTTYRFVDDVVREVGALVPTPYFHIGGDEVEKLTHEQYTRFIERVQGIVHSHGKRMIGWGEIAPARLAPTTIVQHWKRDSSHVHAARGGTVIMSPSSRAYLDMKYDSTTALGLAWAGHIDVRHAYDWEPATQIDGVLESAILGVEAPLWSETLVRTTDVEFMAFPRLAAVAEIAWSPVAVREWESFRQRLALHGPRLAALGVNFHRSPQVPWVP